MSHIIFDQVSVGFPSYTSECNSIKENILYSRFSRKKNSKKNRINVLDNISFEFNDGDRIGLVGENGSGKTTLLRTLAGVYAPHTGLIRKVGRISTLFELGAGLEAELTGYVNIMRLGLLLGNSKSDMKNLLPSIEDFTELGDSLNAPVRTYSSGMLMRLMFAVSTANKPDILLVDEFFGTGDNKFQEKATKRMESTISAANIFVFASHSSSLIEKYCNKVFHIHKGNIREIH